MIRLRLLLLNLLLPAVAGAVFFAAAGRTDLPVAWALFGVLAVFSVALALTTDPALWRERRAPGPGNQDRLTQPISLVLMVAHWVLAGLAVGRFEWTPLPVAWQLAGLAGYAASLGLVFWAVRANPFYSSAVRVQTDRGHRPIAAGPYRFVRHPGYAGTIVGAVCGAAALGSGVGALPILAFVPLFVRRLRVEDRMLQRDLAGYADYARQVPYRLVVGVY